MLARRSLVSAAVTLFWTLRALSQAEPGIRSWGAPPYWTPPAAGRPAAESVRSVSPLPEESAAASLPSPPLPFVAIAPCRVADTRSTSTFTGQYGPPALPGGGTQRSFTITGQCGIPADAQAVSFNFTVWAPITRGDIRVFPAGGTTPTVSTLNWEANILALANAAVVPLGTGGAITVQVDGAGTIDLIADVNGYYSPLGVVNSVNALSGAVTLSAGSNVSITPSGQTLTIAAAGGGGGVSSLNSLSGALTLAGAGATTVSPSGSTLTISTPAGWNLSGNSGTTSGTDFLGTTDNQALEIKVNSQRVARFEPAGGLPNVVLGDRGNSVLPGVTAGTVSGGGWASLFGAGNGDNIVTGIGGTVGGGIGNQAGDNDGNPNTGQYVTVGGGFYNEAFGEIATIAGGHLNTAPGDRSAVPGGFSNQAGGAMSLAAGNTARVRSATETGTTYGDYGTFVWADSPLGGNAGVAFTSTGSNQFLIRAAGGVGINKNNPAVGALDVAGSVLVSGIVSLPSTGSGGASGVLNLGGSPFLHAQGSANTFVGSGAGNFSLTGGTNTAVGASALAGDTSGHDNTAVGFDAGNRTGSGTGYGGGAITFVANAGGGWNTFVGEGTGATASVDNCTAVGVDAYCDATNQVRLGNFFVSSIGGKVAWSTLSDRRAKKDIRDLPLGLDFVMALRPVEYRLLYGNEKVDMGFVAQDLEALLGDGFNVVDVGGDAGRTLSLRYQDLIAPLVKAVQEQQEEIRELKASLRDLEVLRARLEELEARLPKER